MIDNNRDCQRCTGGASGVGTPVGGGSGSVLIDVNQIFDSCRDRDCFEDARVYLDEGAQTLIEHTGQVRTKSAEICSSSISVEPVQLSRGFFRVNVRYYVRVECEACVCPGKSQLFEGLCALEKSVVLYGGEGEVKIFRSSEASDSFCSVPCDGEMSTNNPTCVVEVAEPVILGTRVIEPSECRCRCSCCCADIPERLSSRIGNGLVENGQRYLAVSLGFFSVIRLERPEQYLVNAVEFSVPDKECPSAENSSPCEAFNRMAFPIEEFSPARNGSAIGSGCGCGRGTSTNSCIGNANPTTPTSDPGERDCGCQSRRSDSNGGCRGGCGR